MIEVQVVYDTIKDKELITLVNFEFPIFIDFIDYYKDKKGKQLMGHWGAKKLPFVTLKNGDEIKIFYSEIGNAVNQLLNYINGTYPNKETE